MIFFWDGRAGLVFRRPLSKSKRCFPSSDHSATFFARVSLGGGKGEKEEVLALLGVPHVHQLVVDHQARRHRPIQTRSQNS